MNVNHFSHFSMIPVHGRIFIIQKRLTTFISLKTFIACYDYIHERDKIH